LQKRNKITNERKKERAAREGQGPNALEVLSLVMAWPCELLNLTLRAEKEYQFVPLGLRTSWMAFFTSGSDVLSLAILTIARVK